MRGPMSENAFSLFFQANALSFFSRKGEKKRIHLLGPRTGLFDGTPHGLNVQKLYFLDIKKKLKSNFQLSRGGARNRSFRIEDDPMGDNFRQSLEDIRVGYRDAAPRVSLFLLLAYFAKAL